MDLFVKWLGKGSVEQAKSVTAVYLNYPERGLRMIWDRLERPMTPQK